MSDSNYKLGNIYDINHLKKLIETRHHAIPNDIGAESFGSIIHAEFEQAGWVIPGLIPEGATLLAGRSKIGKSWLMLQITAAVSHGGIIFRRKCRKRPVLYLALEDNMRRIKARCEAMGSWPHESAMVCCDLNGNTGRELIGKIRGWLDYNLDGFVIVDTWARAFPPSPASRNVWAHDETIMGMVHDMMRRDYPVAGIIVITHLNKSKADEYVDWVDRIRGFASFSAMFDTMMMLDGPRGEPTATLYLTGRDIEDETPLELRSNDRHVWEYTGKLDTRVWDLTHTQRRCYELLKRKFVEGMTLDEIGLALGSPRGAKTHLAALEQEKLVVFVDGRWYVSTTSHEA